MPSDDSDIEKPSESEPGANPGDGSAQETGAVSIGVDAAPHEPENVSSKGGKAVYRIDQPEVPMDEDALLKLLDDDNAPAAPTATYTHPVTGREVYVPQNSKALGPSAIMMTASLLMFVGGSLATSLMVARAFDFHGQLLLIFVISSSAFVLSMAGGLLVRTLGDGKNWFIGAGVGACFGAMAAVIVYLQTQHHPWWQ